MIWEQVGRAQVKDGGELKLYRLGEGRGEAFSLRLDNLELMNSRTHGSEEALAKLACATLKNAQVAEVLVGGLGMGFTLRVVLNAVGQNSVVTVAELVPEVVQWNRDLLGHLNDYPLEDERTVVLEEDVASLLRPSPSQSSQPQRRARFDAVLLDVDNGPEGLTHQGNAWLYSAAGLAASFAALKAGGVLAVWSAHSSQAFAKRLQHTGFKVREERVRASGGRGARHTIWLAERP